MLSAEFVLFDHQGMWNGACQDHGNMKQNNEGVTKTGSYQV